MKLYTRLLLSVPVWGAAAVFLLGTWYAYGEPRRLNVFVLIYGAIGAACIAAAVRICLARAPSRPLMVTLGFLSLVCLGFLVWQCGDFMDWW
jgi:hypothetical protein